MNTNMFPSLFTDGNYSFLAIIIDLIFGEPLWKPYVLHPTVWMNKTNGYLVDEKIYDNLVKNEVFTSIR